jgi:hypothetical protein
MQMDVDVFDLVSGVVRGCARVSSISGHLNLSNALLFAMRLGFFFQLVNVRISFSNYIS